MVVPIIVAANNKIYSIVKKILNLCSSYIFTFSVSNSPSEHCTIKSYFSVVSKLRRRFSTKVIPPFSLVRIANGVDLFCRLQECDCPTSWSSTCTVVIIVFEGVFSGNGAILSKMMVSGDSLTSLIVIVNSSWKMDHV